MGKRYYIGIIYHVNKAWIGGTYYIQNLISALNLISDEEKPIIDIYSIYKEDFLELVRITGYPYMEYNGFDIPFYKRIVPGILRKDRHLLQPDPVLLQPLPSVLTKTAHVSRKNEGADTQL